MFSPLDLGRGTKPDNLGSWSFFAYGFCMGFLGLPPWAYAGLAASSLVLAGCSDDDDRPPLIDVTQGAPRDIPLDRLPEPTSDFAEASCRGRRAPGYAVQCGKVSVPLLPDWEGRIEVGVFRVFSNHDDPQPDPIVYLEGGPGFPGSDAVFGAFEAFEPFLKDRDLVVIDQRGTGLSGDSLHCPEVNAATTDEELLLGLADCSQRLQAAGIDLTAYTTAPSAADVDAVRRAFGYTEWNLLGISYGTRLGLTVLRDYPEGVRSAVLDSVVPLQVDFLAELAVNGVAAFEATFAACEAEPNCRSRYPDLMVRLLSAVTRLNETPLEPGGFALTGDRFVDLLFSLMYVPQGVGIVPWLIDRADQDDPEELMTLLEELLGTGLVGSSGSTFGMHLSVQCAEEVAFTTREIVAEAEAEIPPELVSGLSGNYYFDYCDAWQVPAADPRENEPVESSVPTLLVAGGYDPITPPRYAELVHGDLSQSTFVTLEQLAHGATIDPCGYDLVEQFYADPTAPVQRSCVDDIPAPEFLSTSGSRTVRYGGSMVFATEPPSAAELAELRAQLERRPGGGFKRKPRRPGSGW